MDGLVAVWRESWPATYRSTPGAAAVDAMLRSLDERGAASLVPEGTPAGFCAAEGDAIVATAIHSVGRPIVYLWGFYVLPERQRSGLGSRLMAAVRATAQGKPIKCRVLEASTAAIRFYRAMGFDAVGRDDVDVTPGVEGHMPCHAGPGPGMKKPRTPVGRTGRMSEQR